MPRQVTGIGDGQFGLVLASLAGHAERLAESRVIPHVITPLRDEILSH